MIEELIESKDIFYNISKEGLTGLAIGFLLEKSGMPNCFQDRYSKNQQIDSYIEDIKTSLQAGVMAAFWEKAYDYAISHKGFGEKIQYACKNWIMALNDYIICDEKPNDSIVRDKKETALHFCFLEAFKNIVIQKELPCEKAKYKLHEISFLSFLPKEFECEIKEKIKDLIKNHKEFSINYL